MCIRDRSSEDGLKNDAHLIIFPLLNSPMPVRKSLILFGTSYFIAYLIAAILFYKERIFLDVSYYLFHVVQSENFRVEHQRFILIPSQALAWLGVKLHLSLQTVILLNSINPVLYLWVLFSIT